MVRLVPLLMLLTACRGIYSPDVAARFAEDFEQVRLRIPKKADLDPARADAADMTDTIGLAREYLRDDPGTSMHARYVRALLACAHLMRSETEEARRVMEGIKPNRDLGLVHEHRVINAAIHAVSACRAFQARRALIDLLEERVTIEAFVKSYGSFVAISLPDPVAPAYDQMLGTAVERLRAECFMEVAGDPREMENVHAQRAAMRRLVGEQVYNDTASLLVSLPEAASSETEWLSFLGVTAFIAYGKIFHEIVPMSLGPRQKQWQLEQADGMIQRAKKTARRLAGRAIYAQLGKHLFHTEVEIRGWIETR